MPSVRAPLMETQGNNAESSPAPDASAASRRRSARVVRVPDKFSPQPSLTSKRKRGADRDNDEDVENESPDEGENDDEAGDEDGDGDGADDDMMDEDDDDEEAARRKRRSKKKAASASQSSRTKKPAAKKPKLNGSSGHASSLPTRPKHKKAMPKLSLGNRDADDLYADVFGSGHEPDDVAGRWFLKYKQNMEDSVADLVNCILAASGCNERVTEDDINDPDNCPSRLTELQELYEDQQIIDYPLINRAKNAKSFRDLLVGFFRSFINVLHETDALYSDPALMDNVTRWVASMSSSTLRPFRHTATTVALAMSYGLVEVTKKLDDRVTKLTQQIESETSRQSKKKDKSSQQRAALMQTSLDEADNNRSICTEHLKEFFDTVFVHRYRDVDPRIRTECVEALGSWVWLLPDVYMEPGYLRYLGWMLSDTFAATRQEVLRQLGRLFKRDAEKLGHFIEKFRPRLVEMATLDADISVRVAAISVIENLRATGMLLPHEIDAIGRLIFDSEVRVRKAVVNFFADCVQDLVESKTEDVGGEETIQELFAEEQEDFDSPRPDWVNVKSLAATLAAYEGQLEDGAQEDLDVRRTVDTLLEIVGGDPPESRVALAAQVLHERIPEISNWEILIGYLMFDHTTSKKSRSKSKSKDAESTFRNAVAPEGEEETVLLEVLVAAVKTGLAQGQEGEKNRRRAARADGSESQEDSAMHLAGSIPKLLRKFGAEPRKATVVLQLARTLDFGMFQRLRQDPTTFEKFLDEICTQFNRHVDTDVISEAAAVLIHSRQYEDLEEVVEGKLSTLWEDVINSLRNFDKSCELSVRGNLDLAAATELCGTLFKICKLATIINCVDVLEAEGSSVDSSSAAIDILINTVHRGRFLEPNEELDNVEDDLVANASKAAQFYFLWKKRWIRKSLEQQAEIPDEAIDRLSVRRKNFHVNLIHTLSSRAYNDDLRIFATCRLCDISSLYVDLRKYYEQLPSAGRYRSLKTLIGEIPAGLVNELISIYDGAERALARRMKRSLNEPGEDEDPLEDDQLSDDEDEEDLSFEGKLASTLKAERTLCDLASSYVLAIAAKVLDTTGPQAGKLQKRMRRNQRKLGNHVKEIINALDERRPWNLSSSKKKSALKGKTREPSAGAGAGAETGAVGAGTNAAGGKKAALSEEIVVEDDSSDGEGAGGGAAAAAERRNNNGGGNAIDDDDDSVLSSLDPEEGTEEDLRRRELLDEPGPEENGDENEDDTGAANGDDMDEDILGD